uniref:Reverse transcriptase domain-containing protein n=1 Tax=Tanacetum cinerariifolium TaxID=118510 RepID=A0A699J6K5_TANCI|nr:reverse transcriptase domain-containing protein [Tanacetum cinerariifolium]
MARKDAMTIKIDAQYKELQSQAKQPTPDINDDDMPIQQNDNNRDNYRSNTDDKPYNLQKQFNDFMKSQQSTNAFVKETFMDLKTQLETVAKNQQASIQNLKTKFDILADMQSGRPSGSLPSNTQPNPRGSNSKAYQPPQARNEHVNAVFTRIADIAASINLMPYSLYAKLSLKTLKPTKIIVRLADISFQYPVGIAKNMLIEVGKLTFLADFIILEMKEDNKVPLIPGRPFLHTADVVIRVKRKQLNLGVRIERMIFNSDSVMKHSYSNDDTCFTIDIIDEILEEDFDAVKLKPLPDNLEFVILSMLSMKS